MRYCVLYPNAKNVHLIKDVGMIAYKLHKLYGSDSFIASYDNDTYAYLDKEVKGLKIDFIDRKYNNDIMDGITYLKKNAKKIDVLQLFHITLRSVFYAFSYKLFNRKGKIFLKLDCTEKLIDVISSLNRVRFTILKLFLKRVDLIGVEKKVLFKKLESMLSEFAEKLEYIPNGIDYQSSTKFAETNFTVKENIILSVSRFGSPEKAADILLRAFSRIENIDKLDWKLVLIGPVEDEFNKTVEEFFKHNPGLKDKIELKGPFYDREALFEEYIKAKVFCLSSRYESFGIALLEGAAFGDVIVSTDVGIAGELADNGRGFIAKACDPEALAKQLERCIIGTDLEELSRKTQQFCSENYDWNEIVGRLHLRIGQ